MIASVFQGILKHYWNIVLEIQVCFTSPSTSSTSGTIGVQYQGSILFLIKILFKFHPGYKGSIQVLPDYDQRVIIRFQLSSKAS